MTPQDAVTAISTFTSALASVCDGQVRIVCDGQAFTDGATIHLPRPTQALSKEDLEAIFGVGCHEGSHVYYKTVPYHRAFVESYPKRSQFLAADCFNATLDIADESRFERRFPLARKYFTASTTMAALQRLAADNRVSIATTREVLCVAMLRVRKLRISHPVAINAISRAVKEDSLVKTCVAILSQAVSKSGQGTAPRHQREWDKLNRIANELFTLLANSDRKAPRTKSRSAKALELTKEGGGGPLADLFREVITEATGGKVTFPFSPIKQGDNKFGLKGNEWVVGNKKEFNSFRRYAKLLLESTAPVACRPSSSGTRLGDVTRLHIDGKCLLRRAMTPRISTAVAICLDASDSMGGELCQVAGAAGALAEALQGAGGAVSCFHFGTTCHRVAIRSVHRVQTLGDTNTHIAIKEARSWLCLHPEKKQVVVVFTDGYPSNLSASAEEVTLCTRSGIAVLVGTLEGVDSNLIYRSMPGASVFHLGNNLGLGFHHAICRIARRR